VSDVLPRPGLLTARRAYDLAATSYDAWNWQSFWRRAEYPLIRRLVEERLSVLGKARILDVACGTGWHLAQLGRGGDLAVGIDISAAMLKVARHRLPDAPLVLADARQLPFVADRFDIVLCARVFSHLAHTACAVAQIARVAAPGAMIILTDIDPRHDYQATRLPVGADHVCAETYKHPPAGIAAELIRAGLTHRASSVLLGDGEAMALEALGEPVRGAPVGWISGWTRGD
jgi:ubiquinone/menaquinone biosynthesis C-methylase UbiE